MSKFDEPKAAEEPRPTAVADLPDEDLRRLADEALEALRSGIPYSKAVRTYGIEEPEELELWLQELNAELAARGLEPSSPT
jgi:hypothetical protein